MRKGEKAGHMYLVGGVEFGIFCIFIHFWNIPYIKGLTHMNFYGMVRESGCGLEHFLISHILGTIIPTDVHVFQRAGEKPPTRFKYVTICIGLSSWKHCSAYFLLLRICFCDII